MSKLDDILRGIDAGPISDCCALPITFDEASRWTCPKCGRSVRDGKNWHTGSNRKQQIKDLMLELIGSDRTSIPRKVGWTSDDAWRCLGATNDVLAELRQKVAEL